MTPLAGSRWLLRILAIMSVGMFAVEPCSGQFESDEEAVEARRDGLREGRFPWYDAEADDLQPIDVEADEETAKQRDSQWNATVQAKSGSSGWFWQILGQALKWLFYLLMLALAVFLIYILIRAFINSEVGSGTSIREIEDYDVRSEQDLIESLPFLMQRPQSDLFGEARKHYEQGRYNEAIIYLYSYMLVKLDQNNVIRLTRGKTNRQYLRETRAQPELAGLLEPTMLAFEDVFFGHHQLEASRFEACWRRLDRFHECLEGVALA